MSLQAQTWSRDSIRHIYNRHLLSLILALNRNNPSSQWEEPMADDTVLAEAANTDNYACACSAVCVRRLRPETGVMPWDRTCLAKAKRDYSWLASLLWLPPGDLAKWSFFLLFPVVMRLMVRRKKLLTTPKILHNLQYHHKQRSKFLKFKYM